MRHLVCALAALITAAPAFADGSRTFTFRYAMKIGSLPEGAGPVTVWVPLAVSDESQRVVAEEIEASIPGETRIEDAYGNRYWQGRLDAPGEAPVTIVVETTVERAHLSRDAPAASAGIAREERAAYARFLGPNERVFVDHPMLEPIRAEVHAMAGSGDKAATARAIYDWVVDNVEYKKVATGWGNGDTFWACTERYGNCTDFHALFISLARAEGIPARFEMGFPVPDDRPAGEIGGYHCWVRLYLPETGWFPIDASEASKHPERRELFFGGQPADRIHFSTGRDLRLGDEHRGKALNYFVYPYVEVDGAPWKGQVEQTFSFREVGGGA